MKVKYKPLLESGDHFINGYEKDPQQRGDLQLYGGTPLAKELWAEWLPIYVGISNILGQIQTKLSQADGGDAASKSAQHFLSELKKTNDNLVKSLENSEQEGREKLLLGEVNNANNLLKKIHKFIETSDKLFTKEERAAQEKEAQEAREKAEARAEKARATASDTRAKMGDVITSGDKELPGKMAAIVQEYVKGGTVYDILTGQDKTRANSLAAALKQCFIILNSKDEMTKFIKFLTDNVPLLKISPRHYENLIVLAESLKKGRLYTKKDNPIFKDNNIEVFTQSRADFNYTVELFNLWKNGQLATLLGKLTPQTYDTFTKSLFNGNDPNNKIKKAGFSSKDKSEKTLYGTVTIFSNVERGVGARTSNERGETGTVKVGDTSLQGFNHIPKTITAAKNAEKISVNGVFTYDKEKRAWRDSQGTLWRPEIK